MTRRFTEGRNSVYIYNPAADKVSHIKIYKNTPFLFFGEGIFFEFSSYYMVGKFSLYGICSMREKGLKLLWLGCCIGLAVSTIQAQPFGKYNRILRQGEEAIKKDNIEKALTLWKSATEGPSEQITDPRIGISYIELVTKEHLIDQYSKASELYYWGLSNPIHPNSEEELAQEIERLKPVASREEYKKWRRLVKEGRLQSLGKSILGFWRRMDPTLDTSFNERLLEHWKRIAYAKEHFRRSTNTVYETDDRTLPYLKYGEPDRKRNGIMHLNIGQIRNWINDGSDISSMPDLSTASNDSMRVMRSLARKRFEVQKMLNNIKLLHRYPTYEIWVYRDVVQDSRNENLIYIFGNNGNTGEFTMLNSLEEMMPNSAFRPISHEPNAVPPSYFMQLLYYGEMISVDSYFADAFRELESQLYSIRGPTRYSSYSQRDQNRSKLIMTRLRAPVQQSTYASRLPDIPVDVQQYRLLDEQNKPYLATFIYSRPHKSFYVDQINRNLFDQWAYSINTSVIGTDRNNEVLYRRNNTQGMKTDSGRVEEMRPIVDYFEVPHDSTTAEQVFSVELRNSRMDSTAMREVLFTENIRALGKRTIPQTDPPLSTDRSTLEMGDLMIGYKDSLLDVSSDYGFIVNRDRAIPEGEDLIVHIEIYHLNADSAGPVPFKIDYSVSTDKNFFQRLFSGDDDTRLTLNFETTSSTFRDNLEVDTSPFNPGVHTLTLKVTDLSTDQVVEKQVDFKIVEEKREDESRRNLRRDGSE